MELLTKEVTLSDKRVVVMQELTGLDDTMIDRLFRQDKTITKDTAPAGVALALVKYGALYSISVIDGTEVRKPTKLGDLMKLAQQFKKRDLDKLVSAYTELNNEEDDSGESQADEQSF